MNEDDDNDDDNDNDDDVDDNDDDDDDDDKDDKDEDEEEDGAKDGAEDEDEDYIRAVQMRISDEVSINHPTTETWLLNIAKKNGWWIRKEHASWKLDCKEAKLQQVIGLLL